MEKKVTLQVQHTKSFGVTGTECYLASITSVLCKQNTRVRVIFHVGRAKPLQKTEVTQHFFYVSSLTCTRSHTRAHTLRSV